MINPVFTRPFGSRANGDVYVSTQWIKTHLKREPSPGEYIVMGNAMQARYLILRTNPHETTMKFRPRTLAEVGYGANNMGSDLVALAVENRS